MIFLASDHNGNMLGKEICEIWNNLRDVNNSVKEKFGDEADKTLQNFTKKLEGEFENYELEKNYEFENMENLTTKFDPADDYPDIAKLLAHKISSPNQNNSNKQEKFYELEDKLEQIFVLENNFGIAICGTGQGICISLNRYKKIRAGVLSFTSEENLVKSLEIIDLLRLHNNANVLCLSSCISPKIAILLIKKFIQTPFSKEIRHIRRIQKLDDLS